MLLDTAHNGDNNIGKFFKVWSQAWERKMYAIQPRTSVFGYYLFLKFVFKLN